MTDETVTPALTVAEWQRMEVEMGHEGWFGADGVVALDGGGPLVLTGQIYVGAYDENGVASGGAEVAPRWRRALAALCLYDQPFGFTQEDVDLLRGAADVDERQDGSIGPMARIPRMRDLANRIAALLPPA